MIRLFVGLAIPDSISQSLILLQGGIPGARWQSREQLHLTLRFIGDVDGRHVADIHDALSALREPAFEIELFGVGVFTQKDPRQLWVGTRNNATLLHLQKKIDTAMTRLNLPADGRKFSPHVTLARLKAPRREKLMEYLQGHALYQSPPFAIDSFVLFRSTLSSNGSLYTVEAEYRLGR